MWTLNISNPNNNNIYDSNNLTLNDYFITESQINSSFPLNRCINIINNRNLLTQFYLPKNHHNYRIMSPENNRYHYINQVNNNYKSPLLVRPKNFGNHLFEQYFEHSQKNILFKSVNNSNGSIYKRYNIGKLYKEPKDNISKSLNTNFKLSKKKDADR